MELKGITCIAGCFLINLTLGTFYSIGNVVDYIVSYMVNHGNPQVTPESGPWLTATYLFGQGLFILIGAKIERVYDCRIALLIGCIIHTAANLATSWALNQNFSILVLLYGFGTGAGCGPAYIGGILAAQGWMPKKKGIATGIIITGFGLGGLLFSPLQTLYMNPQNLPPDNNTRIFPQSVYEKTPTMFLYMGGLIAIMQLIGVLMAFPPPRSELSQRSSSQRQNSNSAGGVIIADEEVLPDNNSLMKALKSKIFYIIGLMMMLVAPGVTFVNALGKNYGLGYLKDDKFLTIVLAVSAVANATGRLTWGCLIEKFGFRICFAAKVCSFAFFIALFPYSFILSSKILYTIWMLGLFFSFSGSFVMFPVYVEQLFGRKLNGMVYGALYMFLALASAITSLTIQTIIGPAMAEKKGDPDKALTIRIATCSSIALLFLVSLAVYFFTLPTRKLENAVKHRGDNDMTRAKNTLANRQDLLFPANKRSLALKSNDGGTLANGNEQSLGSIVRFKDFPKTS